MASRSSALDDILAEFSTSNLQRNISSSVPDVGTWTSYPSLLETVPSTLRDFFEEAACAHLCGRYNDANAILDNHFPNPHKLLILTLQKADLYASQGLHVKRLELLLLALETLGPSCDEAQRLLLELMVADSKFAVYGQRSELITVVRGVRNYLNRVGIDNIGDIQVQMILLYSGAVVWLRSVCNDLDGLPTTMFSSGSISQMEEISVIARKLQDRQCWQHCSSLLLFRFQNDTKMTVKSASETSSVAVFMHDMSSPGLKYRSALLHEQISATLMTLIPAWAIGERQLCMSILSQLKDSTFGRKYESLTDFAPGIALKINLALVELSPSSVLEKLDRLKTISQFAQEENDWMTAEIIFIKGAFVARQAATSEKVSDADSTTRDQCQRWFEEGWKLHRDKTNLALFEGYALVDYLRILTPQARDADLMRLVMEFEERHPHFDIPTVRYDAYTMAAGAADREFPKGAAAFWRKASFWLEFCPRDGVWANLHPSESQGEQTYYSDYFGLDLARFRNLFHQEYSDILASGEVLQLTVKPSKVLIDEAISVLKSLSPDIDERVVVEDVHSVLEIALTDISDLEFEPKVLFEILLPSVAPKLLLLPLIQSDIGDRDSWSHEMLLQGVSSSMLQQWDKTRPYIPSTLTNDGIRTLVDRAADEMLEPKKMFSLEKYFEWPNDHTAVFQYLQTTVATALKTKQEMLTEYIVNVGDSLALRRYAIASLFWTLKILLFLRTCGFVQDRLSFLVGTTKTTVSLTPLFCADLVRLLCDVDFNGHLLDCHKGASVQKVLWASMKYKYGNFLRKIRLQAPDHLNLGSLATHVSNTLDQILLLYVYAHSCNIQSAIRQQLSFERPIQSCWLTRVRPAKMSCLSRMLGGEDVFMIEQSNSEERRESFESMPETKIDSESESEPESEPESASRLPIRFSMKTDITTLNDIWGPVSKVEIDGKVVQYNVRGGSIVPWQSTTDTNAPTNGKARACHFVPYNLLEECSRVKAQYQRRIVGVHGSHPNGHESDADSESENSSDASLDESSSGTDISDDIHVKYLTQESPEELICRSNFALANPLNLDDILLIGATVQRTLFDRTKCTCRTSRFEKKYKHDLHDLFSREEVGVLELANFGAGLNFQGVGLKADMNIKKMHAFYRDRIIDQWTNYRGTCKIRNLQVYGAVMVSRCTRNAIRCTILDLFRTRTIRIIVELFKDGGELPRIPAHVWKPFLDGDVDGILDVWDSDADSRPPMKEIVYNVLRILSFTGLDLDRKEFNTLWMPSDEYFLSRLVSQPNQHTWMKVLRDGGEASAFAVLSDESFRFPTSRDLGDPCGKKSKTPTCLETAIVVDEGVPPFEAAVLVHHHENKHVKVEDNFYILGNGEHIYVKAPFYRLVFITSLSEAHIVCAWDSSVTRKLLESVGKKSFAGRGHKEKWKENEDGLATHIVSTKRAPEGQEKTTFNLLDKGMRLLYM